MKVSYYWLQQFVDFDYTPDELADVLTLLGLEVASITPVGQQLDKVVVADVKSVQAHPQADKLCVCEVYDGSTTYNIVCGAPNVAAGQRVAFAKEGAQLPGGMTIKKAKIRGVESCGMICSQKELGLGDDAGGIMVLDDSFALGKELSTIPGLRDWILEIELTPNRPDCLSILGVAREISVVTGNPLKNIDSDSDGISVNTGDTIPITIKDADLCGNYSAIIIRGVKVAPSPFWLANMVEKLGMRSINTVVDVTNYVLMEMGHPLHAFDLNKLKGPEIIVRRADQDEQIVTIDDKDRTLNNSMLVIADRENPVAVAGVMGGAYSEVDDATTDILLEGAYFNPVSVRKTSKTLGLSTEASHRFERGTDRLGFKTALRRAAYLIAQLGNAKSISELFECEAKPASLTHVSCNTKRIQSLLGIDISHDKIVDIIQKLGMTIINRNNENLKLEVPSYRVDIEIEEDIVEEVARIYGYNNIPMAQPGSSYIECDVNMKLMYARFTRDILVGAGYFETLTCSLVPESVQKQYPSWCCDASKAAVCVKNPISEMQQALQTSLIPNMLDTISLNVKQKAQSIQIFELGNIFVPKTATTADEKYVLSIAVSGAKQGDSWQGVAQFWDFFSFKGFLEGYFDALNISGITYQRSKLEYLHPGRCADIFLGDTKIGIIGQIHPQIARERDIYERTFVAEIDAGQLIERMNLKGSYTPLPKYPAIDRDLAIVIDAGVEYQTVCNELARHVPDLLEEWRLVSVYEGNPIPAGKKSLSLRMRYRSAQTTLTDEDVDAVHNEYASKIVKNLGCELR